MADRVAVHGTAEVARGFGKVEHAAKDLQATHRKVAQATLPAIAARTPRLTGLLASSWRATARPGAGGIVNGLPYAPPIEYGVKRHNIEGAHMVAEGLAASEDAMRREYETALDHEIRRVGFATR